MSGVYVVCTTSNNKIEVNWHEDAKLKCDVSDFYYVNDICLILWIFNRITSFFPLSLTHEIVADQLTRAYQTQCPCGCRPFVTHQRLSRCGLRLNWTMVKANRKQTTNVWWWNWIVHHGDAVNIHINEIYRNAYTLWTRWTNSYMLSYTVRQKWYAHNNLNSNSKWGNIEAIAISRSINFGKF